MHYTIPITQRLKKTVKSLHQKNFRDQNGLYVAEGIRLCTELMNSGLLPELIVIKESASQEVLEVSEFCAGKGVPIYSSPKHSFTQMCDTKTPQGIIAVINTRQSEPLPDQPFIALDGVSDPGNVGTIIRTADWFGFTQIILGRDCADKYNSKTVRSTMGSIFRVKVIETDNLAEYLKEVFPKRKILAATLDTETDLKKCKAKNNYGLIFGSEANGLSKDVDAIVDTKFKIPGSPNTESLNVAVSVGISLYHFNNH